MIHRFKASGRDFVYHTGTAAIIELDEPLSDAEIDHEFASL